MHVDEDRDGWVCLYSYLAYFFKVCCADNTVVSSGLLVATFAKVGLALGG